jgi:hypothetical protein
MALEPISGLGFNAAAQQQGDDCMRKVSFALVGAAALALAACGGKGVDSLGENVQENMENAADALNAAAEATGNETLANQSAALREAGDNAEAAIDAADVNAQEVNAM